MNKVYIVFEDNGERYEDFHESIIKVFESKKHAVRFIQNLKAKETRKTKKSLHYDIHHFRLEKHEIEKETI